MRESADERLWHYRDDGERIGPFALVLCQHRTDDSQGTAMYAAMDPDVARTYSFDEDPVDKFTSESRWYGPERYAIGRFIRAWRAEERYMRYPWSIIRHVHRDDGAHEEISDLELHQQHPFASLVESMCASGEDGEDGEDDTGCGPACASMAKILCRAMTAAGAMAIHASESASSPHNSSSLSGTDGWPENILRSHVHDCITCVALFVHNFAAPILGVDRKAVGRSVVRAARTWSPMGSTIFRTLTGLHHGRYADVYSKLTTARGERQPTFEPPLLPYYPAGDELQPVVTDESMKRLEFVEQDTPDFRHVAGALRSDGSVRSDRSSFYATTCMIAIAGVMSFGLAAMRHRM